MKVNVKSYQGEFECELNLMKPNIYDILMDEPTGTCATVTFPTAKDAIDTAWHFDESGITCSGEEHFIRVPTTQLVKNDKTGKHTAVANRVFYHLENESNSMIEAVVVKSSDGTLSNKLRLIRVNPTTAIKCLSLNDIYMNEFNGDKMKLRKFKSYKKRAKELKLYTSWLLE